MAIQLRTVGRRERDLVAVRARGEPSVLAVKQRHPACNELADRVHPSSNVIAETRAWVDRAVIGLNLCPFARAVQVKNQIRYAVSDATDPDALLATLREELHLLAGAEPARVETTLLIHPQVMTDFLDYNDFLDVVDAAIEDMELDGVIQVASFHPDYQFGGTEPDDVENYSNRAPYPTLHLIRESSLEQAVAAFPNAEDIYETNIETLRKLGHEGWKKLWQVG